jgi:nitroimidazol reductase NimA-like FMN-containing flavoprotein (pyridoxamine 5'-phosphate oxidase superfamily)
MSEAWLEPLSEDECLALLRAHGLGRIALVADGWPVVFPVNYRLVETGDRTWIALRTRPGNVIDRLPLMVAFQIDGVDPARRQGWSVLARGTLHRIDPEAPGVRERFDPDTWIVAERDAWLTIDSFMLSGRRLQAAESEWPFHDNAYL